ncbi:hypothetical protein BX070DRAFT_230042 [Coemansia spiralis]|nr:hypothetical protein BX070DRAFT_230042 [Coemansia spiralis]
MAIVRVLMRQAGGRPEQRVLRASYHGLRREVHVGAEQQRHYEAALDDHFLAPSRTRVHIPRAVTGEHPEPHTVYLIELQQTLDSTAATGWVVERRYREFFSLHRDLRSMYPAEMRRHDLPSRTPLVRLQRDRDIEHRRAGLEKYLQGLLREPRLCASRPLRVFLSSTDEPDQADPEAAGWMAQIYKTVGEDLEGITGADSMLEIIVQELGSQVALQQPRTESPVESTVFVDPLSDLFIEVFGLRNRRNWLRRQAISILLRHIVGGTVERRVRDVLTVDDARIAGLLSGLRQTLWPLDGKSQHYLKFQGFKARTTEEKNECKERAKRQVLWFLPRVLSGMVGRKNARDGAALLVDSVQNQMANLSLALHIFDAVIVAVFPEVKYQLEHLLES